MDEVMLADSGPAGDFFPVGIDLGFQFELLDAVGEGFGDLGGVDVDDGAFEIELARGGGDGVVGGPAGVIVAIYKRWLPKNLD